MSCFNFLLIIIIFTITFYVIRLSDELLERFYLKDDSSCCNIDTYTSNANEKDILIQPENDNLIQPEKPPETVDINSEYIIILSRENCPFCTILIEDYSSKTSKKYAIVNLKNNLTFSFDNNFINIEPLERENIIKGLQDVLTRHPILFPTVIYNKNIIRGLKRKELDNIFFDLE